MTSPKSPFLCKAAITRDVPTSLAKEALRMDESEVDIEKAKVQHQNYKKALSDIGLKVYNIEADESLPDCVFVEDPVVVVGNRAMLTTLGHPSRRKEKEEMKKVLMKINGMEIFEMSKLNKEANLDGGDVLYTGTEMFIGLSARTNLAAVEVMQSCFKQLKVHPIPVKDGLHLKSCMTLAGPNSILCSTINEGTRSIIEEVKKRATENYNFIEVSCDPKRANVVYLETNDGSVLLHTKMTAENDIKALDSIKVDKKIMMDNSELGKVDGCLTCCSVLLTV